MAKSSFGSSLYAFSSLGRTYAPGSSFWAFSTNGRTYSQKQPQEAYFDNFRALAAQVAKSSSRKLLTSNTAREICVKLKPHETYFEHFQALAAHTAKSGPRKLILNIFGPWPQIWSKVALEAHFINFQLLAAHMSQEAHFQHFQPMAAHIAKSNPRKLILTIFGPWPHKWLKVVPGSSWRPTLHGKSA